MRMPDLVYSRWIERSLINDNGAKDIYRLVIEVSNQSRAVHVIAGSWAVRSYAGIQGFPAELLLAVLSAEALERHLRRVRPG